MKKMEKRQWDRHGTMQLGRVWVGLLVVIILSVLGSCTMGDSTGDSTPEVTLDCNGIDRAIVFAGFDWGSAQIHNHIVGRILQDGFGCEFEDAPGPLDQLFQGLAQGEIDIVMEVWVNTAPDTYRDAIMTGDVVDLGLNTTAREHSFLVPRYVIDGDAVRGIQPMAPDLRAVADLPRYSSVFQDPEESGKGRYYNCVPGWQCEQINTDKLATYGLHTSFTNFHPESAHALAGALRAAYESGEPWLGYYWGPTAELGRYDMVVLDEPAYSDECWVDGNHGCAYPTVPIHIAISKRFSEVAAEPIIDFLRAYELDRMLMSDLLAFMSDEPAEAATVANHFLSNQSHVWNKWVSDEVADRIKASLDE